MYIMKCNYIYIYIYNTDDGLSPGNEDMVCGYVLWQYDT